MIEKLVTMLITWLFTPSAKKESTVYAPNPHSSEAKIIRYLNKQTDPIVIGTYYTEAKKRNAPYSILSLIGDRLKYVSSPEYAWNVFKVP